MTWSLSWVLYKHFYYLYIQYITCSWDAALLALRQHAKYFISYLIIKTSINSGMVFTLTGECACDMISLVSCVYLDQCLFLSVEAVSIRGRTILWSYALMHHNTYSNVSISISIQQSKNALLCVNQWNVYVAYRSLKFLTIKEIYTIIWIGIFCVHKPGFLMYIYFIKCPWYVRTYI